MADTNSPAEGELDVADMASELADSLNLGKTTELSSVNPADTEHANGVPVDAESQELSKTTKVESVPTKLPETAASIPENKAPTTTSKPAVETSEAPSTWRAPAKALWAKLPKEIQDEVAKREGDVLRGMGEYKQAADVGNGFHKAVGQYLPFIQQNNLNPYDLARSHFQTHYQLAMGSPQQKVDAIRKMISDFKVPTEGLFSASPELAHVDPEVKRLQSQLEALQSTVTQTATQQAEVVRARLVSEVETFAKDPAHNLFELVADDIAQLINSKACATLQDAYDTAVARNPAARQKALDALIQQRDETTKKEAQERAAAARKSTAANVRSTSKSRGPTAPKGSMEDTMRETAERLYSS